MRLFPPEKYPLPFERLFARMSIAAFLIGCAFARSGFGETYLWNGASGGAWTDPANWLPSTGYPGGGDDVVFSNNAAGGTVTLSGEQAARAIYFGSVVSSNVPGFNISGSPLNLGAGGIHQYSRANNETISAPIRLSADSILAEYSYWPGQKDFNINGGIDNNGHALRLHSEGYRMLVNQAVSGTGLVEVTGDDSVYLRAANTFSGGFSVSGARAVLDGASGSIPAVSSLAITAGGRLEIGETGNALADDGTNTFGRVPNNIPVMLSNCRYVKLVGGNGANTVERMGAVDIRNERNYILVNNGSGADATLVLASLVRNPQSRPLLIVGSDNYNLGGLSRIVVAGGLTNWQTIGGSNSRGTDKAIVPCVFSATQPSYTKGSQAYLTTFVRYDETSGFVPLHPSNDFVNATDTNFPAVAPDGNDNVRLPWLAVHPTNAVYTNFVPASTTINSLVIFDDLPFTADKELVLAGPPGATLTIKSGMILVAASSDAKRYYAAINVSTLDFAQAEGVIAAGWTHYGWINVNSALAGTNGLTITTHDSDDQGSVYLNADNRNLRGQITIAGGFENYARVVPQHRYALGDGSNDLFLAGAKLVPWVSDHLTVRSLSGSGLVYSQWNASGKRLNIGGNGTGSENNTVKLLDGGTISPGLPDQAGVLTIERFTQVKFLGGTVRLDIFAPCSHDVINLAGSGSDVPTLSINAASLEVNLGYRPAIGDTFAVIKVAGTNAVSGQFAQGSVVMARYGQRKFFLDILYNSSLAGCDGNDIVLRVARYDAGGTVFVAR